MTFTRLCITVIAASVLLSSCGSSNKFASSFGKRKYTKGYYADVAGAVPKVASKEVKHSITKQVVSTPVKHVTAPVQQTIAATAKPVEKHTSITVSKSTKKIVKVLTAVLPSPIVSAVSSISTYGGRHDGGDNSNTSLHVALSVLLFFTPIIVFAAGIGDGWFANLTNANIESLIVLWMALLVASVVCSIIAIDRREPGYGACILVMALDALLFLIGLGLIAGGI